MHYSDAVRDPAATIAKLADFYGVDLSAAEAEAVGRTCSKEHMTANEHVFDYKLPMNPATDTIMSPNSFINKADVATTTLSPETIVAWDAACESEFPDPVQRTWAAEGGPLP